MILNRIALKNFRTYESLDLALDSGITIVSGTNAAGKTNLVEAINYLSLARTWRSGDDRSLIREGAELACIEADIKEGVMSRHIEVELSQNEKRIRLNGKLVRRLSELSKLTNVLLFAPKDVSLFLNGPQERRNYLDVSLSKQSLDYFSLIGKYGKLLKERNAALKAGPSNSDLVEVLTDQMISIAEPLIRYRSMYVASLNELLPGIVERLTGSKTSCRLIYKPFAKPDGSFVDKAKKIYKEALEGDFQRGFTGNGPHREDFSFQLNGKDIAEFGSQGENRTAALALKLAPYFLVEGEAKKPIIVLDDVTSELDANRVERLISLLREMGQVFITATKLEIDGASHIDVSDNKAVRR